MFLSVIIPAYNEEARLTATLLAVVEYFDKLYPSSYEVIVVDDGSTDSTSQLASQFSESHPQVSVLEYGANRGKGYAVRRGMLKGSGECRLFCDADLATPMEEFEVVLARMQSEGSAIGIGSRPLRESHLLVHQPWYREFLGRSFNKVVQMLAAPGIQDTQCGFKIFSAQAADAVFSRCLLDGFAFDAEALFLAKRFGYRVSEVPIRWSHKSGSKVNMARDGLRMVRDVVRLRGMHRDLSTTK